MSKCTQCGNDEADPDHGVCYGCYLIANQYECDPAERTAVERAADQMLAALRKLVRIAKRYPFVALAQALEHDVPEVSKAIEAAEGKADPIAACEATEIVLLDQLQHAVKSMDNLIEVGAVNERYVDELNAYLVSYKQTLTRAKGATISASATEGER